MGLFDQKPKTSDEARNLVSALRSISTAILDDAQAHAWREHEAGRLSDSSYFIVVKRLHILAGNAS